MAGHNEFWYTGEGWITVEVPEEEEPTSALAHLCTYEPEHPTYFIAQQGPVSVEAACDPEGIWVAQFHALTALDGVEHARLIEGELHLEVTDGPRSRIEERTALANAAEAARTLGLTGWSISDEDADSSVHLREEASSSLASREVIDAVLAAPVPLKSVTHLSREWEDSPDRVEVHLGTSGQVRTYRRALRQAVRRTGPENLRLLVVSMPSR